MSRSVTELKSTGNGSEVPKMRLRSVEPAFWASVWTSELSAFRTSPDYNLSTAWAWKLGCLCPGSDYSVA
jgi:hypothetical protein